MCANHGVVEAFINVKTYGIVIKKRKKIANLYLFFSLVA